jgi:hypothetical protein
VKPIRYGRSVLAEDPKRGEVRPLEPFWTIYRDRDYPRLP